MKEIHIIDNEDGSVLVIALIMLVLLTILGITATSTSNIELQIAGNERNYKRTFFVANAGLEDVRYDVSNDLVIGNQAIIASGGDPNWDFLLLYATSDTDGDGIPDVPRILLTDFVPDNKYQYKVVLYDNDDDGDYTVDTDQRIYAKVTATGPNNAAVILRVMLQATVNGEAITSYTAQQGGESGKGYGSQDLNPVGDFSVQI